MTIHNPEIAKLLDRYAVLLEIKGANPFRIRAYRNAARTIENLSRDVSAMLGEGSDLTELPGIGEDLAHKLADIVATEKFKELETLKHQLPSALADLTEIPGIGPSRIKTLFKKLKVKSLSDLFAAARKGRLQGLPGFGPKLEASILKAAKAHSSKEKRYKLVDAERIAGDLIDYLARVPGVLKAEVAGSYRRRKATVGDLDVLVACKKRTPVIDKFVSYPEVTDVLARGVTKASVRLKSGMQVDLRVVPEESFGAALVYFTGSKAHNIALRTLGLKRGLKFNEYGVYRKNRWLAGQTEKDVYAQVGLPLISAELREAQGEIEAAETGKLPNLVSLADIRGDLHAHTSESDGESSIEELAEAARALGYQYLAITDHSKFIGITHGLDTRRLIAQMRKIDRLNGKFRGFTLLKSVEVDILADGTLALPDSVLADLDLVVAAVHSKFDLPGKAQTERIIRAMDHPNVNIIAHPSGRLIDERDPYELDIRRLMKAALDRGCYLEANAQPSRLDLSDTHCRMARELGLKLSVSTDAHTPETLGYMRFGVDQARRGWLSPSDVLNTRPVDVLVKLLKRK